MTGKELEKIYNEAYKAVYWTAMQFLKNEADAEDVVQDAFISFMESYDGLSDKSKAVALLKKIAANKCLDRIKLSRTDVADDEFFEDVEAVPEDFLPDSIVESEDARRIVMDIINNSLSEDIRRTLILFYFDEMSTKEIAEALGVPEGTVRRRLNFARNKIKKEVERYEEENKTKLFGMAALPFLSKLFAKEAAQVPFKAMPASLINLSASAGASGKGAVIKASAEAVKKGTDIMKLKLFIGIFAPLLAVGVTVGIIVAVMNKKPDTKPEETEEFVAEITEESQDEQAPAKTAESSDDETDVSESDEDIPGEYSFAVLVTDCQVIEGEGSLITGEFYIHSGILRVGDKVKVVDSTYVYGDLIWRDESEKFKTVEATVLSIKDDSGYVNEASSGWDIEVMLDIEIHEDILYSTFIVEDLQIYNTRTIVAEFYAYTKDQGGKKDAGFEYYNPYFRFGNDTVLGYFTFQEDMTLFFPGDFVEEIYIHPEREVDVKVGDEFEFIENGRVIGTGKVIGFAD